MFLSQSTRVVTVLLFSLLLAACTPAYKKAAKAGFDPTKPHKLLNLKYVKEPYSHSSFSGAFLFPVGGVSGSSNSGVEPKVGFVALGTRGRVIMLQYKAEDIDYTLDRTIKIPYVQLSGGWSSGTHCWDGSASLTFNIQECTWKATIHLAPQDFSEDIAVIKYVGALG